MPIPPVQGATGREAATPPPSFASRRKLRGPVVYDAYTSRRTIASRPFTTSRATPTTVADRTAALFRIASMPACFASSHSSISPAATPFFLVGQDAGGHWLAVETHGRGGGLFASRDAALGYVRHEAGPERSAFQIADTPIDLTFPARRNS